MNNRVKIISQGKSKFEKENSNTFKLIKPLFSIIKEGLDTSLFRWLEDNNFVVDAIITDPPYNISKKNNFKTIGRAGIDFGEWDYTFDQETWIETATKFLKPGGSIIIFNDYKNIGQICKKLESCGFEIKDLLRWEKNNPMPRNTNRRYITDFEVAIWAVKKGNTWTFNKDSEIPYLRPKFAYPLVSKKVRIHPTQKNVAMLEEIIRIHTNENDTILDPFMGSSSTGVAAIKQKRNFIGSELEKETFDKAEKWLTKVWKGLNND